jgi:hypothetical protein
MLTAEQQEHLHALTGRFVDQVTEKYVAGQKEHGGDLWRKKGIIKMAKEEVVDMWVYLDTLEQQLKDAGIVLGDIAE